MLSSFSHWAACRRRRQEGAHRQCEGVIQDGRGKATSGPAGNYILYKGQGVKKLQGDYPLSDLQLLIHQVLQDDGMAQSHRHARAHEGDLPCRVETGIFG